MTTWIRSKVTIFIRWLASWWKSLWRKEEHPLRQSAANNPVAESGTMHHGRYQ